MLRLNYLQFIRFDTVVVHMQHMYVFCPIPAGIFIALLLFICKRS